MLSALSKFSCTSLFVIISKLRQFVHACHEMSVIAEYEYAHLFLSRINFEQAYGGIILAQHIKVGTRKSCDGLHCLSARYATTDEPHCYQAIRVVKSHMCPLSFSHARNETSPEFVHLLRIFVIEMRFSLQLSKLIAFCITKKTYCSFARIYKLNSDYLCLRIFIKLKSLLLRRYFILLYIILVNKNKAISVILKLKCNYIQNANKILYCS